MISRNELIAKARNLICAHQTLSGLVVVIMITVIMTSISMTLYVYSGASGLDLSRPAFEKARKRVQTDNENAKSGSDFSPSGELKAKDIDEFTTLFNGQKDRLDKMGRYDEVVLSDEYLGLVESAPAEAQ